MAGLRDAVGKNEAGGDRIGVSRDRQIDIYIYI